MYVIDGTNIKLTRGDSFYCEISMKNSSGEPYEPQAGDVVRFYLKRDLLNPPKSEYIDRNPLISKAVPTDTMILHLEPDDTKELGFGEYVYYEPASDIARPTITWSKTHSEAPFFVLFVDATGTAHSATNSSYVFAFVDYYKLYGTGVPYSSSGFRYATAFYNYRGTSTSSISTGGTICSYNSNNTSSSGSSYPRYWVSPTDFHPYTGNTSRYWRSGRTYKWIAVWKP